MAVLVKMPIDAYRDFLGRFPLSSRGYAVLTNSILQGATTSDSSIIEMLCQIDDVKLILERANRFYPRAAPYLEKALTSVLGGEYRKTSGDAWHFNSNCSLWPMADYVSSQDAPDNSTICNECIVKKQHGDSSA
jgi:hypothetical protein